MPARRLPRWSAPVAVAVSVLALGSGLATHTGHHAATSGAVASPAPLSGSAAAIPSTTSLPDAATPGPSPASASPSGAPDALLGSSTRLAGRHVSGWPLSPQCTSPGPNPGTAHTPAHDDFASLRELGSGLRVRRAYTVRGEDLVPADGLTGVRACDAAVWRVVQAGTPTWLHGRVAELLLFDGEDGGDQGQLLGEVEPGGHDPSRWRLALRLDATGPDELLVTSAHEGGHLISLDRSEIAGPESDQCPTYDTLTGCLRPGALLTRFTDQTWSDATYNAWWRADGVQDEGQRQRQLDRFYATHRAQFVTWYAATSPEEDLAETFAYWCVHGPTGGPVGGGRAKLAWLQRDPGLRLTAGPGCEALQALLP
ncbi:MAG: hypothetical protein ACTHJ6_12325 [Oryzihumus sp.]